MNTQLVVSHYNIEITTKDTARLGTDYNFINDNIIDFYIKHWQQYHTTVLDQKQFFIFNTLFYPIVLKNMDRAKQIPKLSLEPNLFHRKYILIPVNIHNTHWNLCIIYNIRAAVKRLLQNRYQNSEDVEVDLDEKCCITFLDSISGYIPSEILDTIRTYLNERFVLENPTAKSWCLFDQTVLPFYESYMPSQVNCTDCGLYLLQFIELFVRDKPTTFPLVKRQWFQPSVILQKKQRILDLFTAYALLQQNNSTPLQNLITLLNDDLRKIDSQR